MSVPVELTEIIMGMEGKMDESTSYLDRNAGEVVVFTDQEIRAAEDDEALEDYPEWEREVIQKAREFVYGTGGEFIALPTQFDIHEYQIMEKFCYSVEDEDISDSLCRAIRGSGAFRRFKDGIHRFGIQDDWYRYRAEAFKKIAIEWCEDNDVQYIDDTAKWSQGDSSQQKEAEELTVAPGITIRQATVRDAAQLARLRWDFSPDKAAASRQSFPDFLDGFSEFVNNALSGGKWWIWVAERDEKLVGNIYVQIVSRVPRPWHFVGRYGYITNLYVEPEERSSGTGSQLLKHVMAWAREKKLDFLMLWPSEDSVEFYEHHGFVRTATAMEYRIS